MNPSPCLKLWNNRSRKAICSIWLPLFVRHVDVPVIAAGRLATGAFADRAIAEGKTDLIGLARVLWADPLWPQKVRDGREADIHPLQPGLRRCVHAHGHERPAGVLCGLAGGEDDGVEG